MNFLSFPLLREKHQPKPKSSMYKHLRLSLIPEEVDKHSVVHVQNQSIKSNTQNIEANKQLLMD